MKTFGKWNLCVCVLRVRKSPPLWVMYIWVTVMRLYAMSAFLTNMFPYRDWLGTLGTVVLGLQRPVLGHRSRTCVQLLKTRTSVSVFQEICVSSAACKATWHNCLVNEPVVLPGLCWCWLTLLAELLFFFGGGGLCLGGPLKHKHMQLSSESQKYEAWQFI